MTIASSAAYAARSQERQLDDSVERTCSSSLLLTSSRRRSQKEDVEDEEGTQLIHVQSESVDMVVLGTWLFIKGLCLENCEPFCVNQSID